MKRCTNDCDLVLILLSAIINVRILGFEPHSPVEDKTLMKGNNYVSCARHPSAIKGSFLIRMVML